MTAPSCVLLGYGGEDPRVAEVSHGLRDALLEIRPSLDVHAAFLDQCPPTAGQLVNKLVRHKASEVVFVPLLLSEAFVSQPEIPQLVEEVRAAHPGLKVIASRPIGPEAGLLAVIDRRLRDALKARRVYELDGLVFAAAGSTDVRSNALVSRRARQWSTHHKLPCVTSFATGCGPSTAEAVRTLRAQGRRHIAVGSWFLSPGELWHRTVEQALDAGALAVSEPMGAEPEIAQAVLARYVVAAMDLVDLDARLAGDADYAAYAEDSDAPVRHLAVVSA